MVIDPNTLMAFLTALGPVLFRIALVLLPIIMAMFGIVL